MLRHPSVAIHCPSSISPPFSKMFFSKTSGPIEAKFHMEPQWDGGRKVCSWGLGHMKKMAATSICGKNPSKIFFPRTKGPMTLCLGMYHWGLGPIIICSNDDPRLTLTYFTARSNLVSYMGKTVRKSFNGRNLQQMTRVTKGLWLYKNSVPKGLSAPALGLYICIKTRKIMYKIILQRYFFEICNKWAKWQGFSIDVRILSTKGCLPLPLGDIHSEKH